MAFAGIWIAIDVSVAFAQAPKVKEADPVGQAKENAVHRVAVSNARARALANDLVGAEQELVAINKTAPNTARWHIETAQRLMQIAEDLARDAKTANVAPLANRALQLLTMADTATNPRTRAAAKELIGHIQERYLANRAAALAAYQAAAQISPTSKRATEAVARLQATEASLRARTPGGGR